MDVGKRWTVRVDDDLAVKIEALAELRGQSVNTLISELFEAEVERLREDPAFRAEVDRAVEEKVKGLRSLLE